MSIKRDIQSMRLAQLKEYFDSIGERPYRADQVFAWLHGGAASFADMTNLPEKLRCDLDEKFYIHEPVLLKKLISARDGTLKYLWGMADGNSVESVVLEYGHGNTVCVSTQVGCRMGCAFCASTRGGLTRNLTPAEMEAQILYSQKDSGKKLRNVVLMGIGEPLDNFDNVMSFLNIISHPAGMNTGMRHISLSTCGVIENIDKLAGYDIKLTLSVSLHAPDDETRSILMPINRKTGVETLIRTCGNYFRATGRRVSYEYAMIDGVNDTVSHARKLAAILRNTGSHLNIIMLNDIPDSPMRASSPEKVGAFTGILKELGVNHTLRRRLGGDISASCGQLRAGQR